VDEGAFRAVVPFPLGNFSEGKTLRQSTCAQQDQFPPMRESAKKGALKQLSRARKYSAPAQKNAVQKSGSPAGRIASAQHQGECRAYRGIPVSARAEISLMFNVFMTPL